MTYNSQIGNYAYPASGTTSTRPHAVTSAGTNSYSYDANGNMTSNVGKTISYDFENRPTSITSGTNTTTFVYDGDGGRVKKTASGTTTIYIGKLYECVSGSCSKYIFASGQRIAIKPVGGTSINYYHTDHLGSSSVITNSAGTKVQSLAYFPYGQTRVSTGSIDVHHKYTSQELDDSTGLYFYNARYYDPALGRFISADSIIPNPRDPQALNRYSYARNNPIIYIDPSGHRWKWLDRQMDRLRENETIQIAVGVGLQLFGGPIGLVAGSYLLTQSETGRNILAGEVIVATAIATAYCGGCGGVALGALVGEAVGGYSAYRAGGDIASGIIVGGALGAITGGIGNYAGASVGGQFGTGWVGHVAGGAVKGAILGAGSGASAGYAGGVGSWKMMLRGAYQGALIGAAAGGAIGYGEYRFTGGGLEDLSGPEIVDKAKQGVLDGITQAAKKGDLGAIIGDVAKSVGKQFLEPALSTMVRYPNLIYGLAYVGVGIEQTDRSISQEMGDRGVSGELGIDF
ncbi:MAG: RHS repeat-associated core domain-containing protein [Nitrospirae bacterium]|nr:RHS repeat-associated core domain-containing protein [Nitrospirota bacterium]